MKKIVSLSLVFYLLLCLSACNNNASVQLEQTSTVTPTATPHTHSFTSTITKKATCAQEGIETFTCECNYSYTKSIEKTISHTWTTATCTAPETCKVCKKTQGKALSHNFENATCTKPKTCKTCGATDGDALGHNWKDATCQKPKTCKTCGITSGGNIDHNWKAATCTTPKTCKTCGATDGDALGHSSYDYHTGKCHSCGALAPALAKCSLKVPSLPQTVSEYNSTGFKYCSFSITKVKHEFLYSNFDGSVSLAVYISGKKLYDFRGDLVSGGMPIVVKLYGPDGSMIESNTKYISGCVGDVFTNEVIIFCEDVEPGQYRIEFFDYYI